MANAAERFLAELRPLGSEAGRQKMRGYFHGSPDTEFLGVRMKAVFDLAKRWTDVPLGDVEGLLESRYYEARVGAVSILDFKARRKRITEDERRELYELYLRRHDRIDNWDLVDRAAPRVVGWYLFDQSRDPLYELAASADIWERRTAITATFWFVRNGDIDDAQEIAERLLHDPEELVNKSVGVALREIGTVDEDRLVDFLEARAATMPRVTLRFATEKLPADRKARLRSLTRH